MADNTQHKLGKTRPPRVQITYDVMVGDATEQRELPFVVGIMADLSGMRQEDPIPLKDRSFVGIYAENIPDIMEHIKPYLELEVENRLVNNKNKFKVSLNFKSMDDFLPIHLIKQIPILDMLYGSRIHLKDLLSKMDGNDELEEMLKDIMQNREKQKQLLKEIQAELGEKPAGSKLFGDKNNDDDQNNVVSPEAVMQNLSTTPVSLPEDPNENFVPESPFSDDKPSVEDNSVKKEKKDDNKDDFF